MHIVYAHGFRSSSGSKKAGILRAHLASHHPGARFVAPDLSFRPRAALDQLMACCEAVPAGELAVAGSSLGGFYAIALAERFGCRAALLNPSIRPFDTLSRHLGPQENMYTGERFTFTQDHIAELAGMAVPVTDPARYLLVVEMGDELLDHRATRAHLAGAREIVEAGGDHDLASFGLHVAEVAAFLVGAPAK